MAERPGPSRRRVRGLAVVLLVILAAVAAYLLAGTLRRASLRRGIPTPPALGSAPAAIRDHLAAADRAAREAGPSAEVLAALCVAYHADLFFDEAIRCYAAAEELAPEGWRLTHARALAHAARGEDAAAIDAFRRVTRAAPAWGPAWWRLGEAAFKARRIDEARAAWDRARSLPEAERPVTPPGAVARARPAPIAAYAVLGLSRLELAQGSPERALALLEPAVAQAPTFGPLVRLLGTVHATLGRPADARRATRIADRLPALDPYPEPIFEQLARESRSATFLLQQASVADLGGQGAWREWLTRRALEVDPGNTDAIFELATLLRTLGRFGEALALLQDYSRRVPGDRQALAAIGRNLIGLQRFDEAEGVLRRALSAGDEANARYDLGVVLDRLGRVREAVEEYERVLRRDPNHRDTLNNLAVDRARLNQLDQAAGRFEQLLRLDPDHADAHVNLGLVRAAQGQRAAADEHFRAALVVDPQNARARSAIDAGAR